MLIMDIWLHVRAQAIGRIVIDVTDAGKSVGSWRWRDSGVLTRIETVDSARQSQQGDSPDVQEQRPGTLP